MRSQVSLWANLWLLVVGYSVRVSLFWSIKDSELNGGASFRGPAFRMGQYRVNDHGRDHPYHAPQFSLFTPFE